MKRGFGALAVEVILAVALAFATVACGDGGGNSTDVFEDCDNGLDDDGDSLIDCDDYRDCAWECGACPPGLYGAECDQGCAGGADTPCSNNGVCDDGVGGTGECTCNSGYYGDACADECPGGAADACSGNGTCSDGAAGAGVCACAEGYFGSDCAAECPGGATDPCTGNGTCDEGAAGTGACTCDSGTFGVDCAGECPGGATNACNGNGACDDGGSGTGVCTCDTGYFGADCVAECPGGALNPCNGNGTCAEGAGGDGTCTCTGAFVGPDCAHEPSPVTVNTTCNAPFGWAGFVIFHDATGAVLDYTYVDWIDVPLFSVTYDTMPPGGMITVGTACDEGAGADFYYRMHTLTEIVPGRTYDIKMPYNQNSFVLPSNVGDLYFDPQLPAAIAGDVTDIITDIGCEQPQQRAVGASPLFHVVTLYCLNVLSGNYDLVLYAVDAEGNVLASATSPTHPYTSDGNTPDVLAISSWTVGPTWFQTLFLNAPDYVMAWGQLLSRRNGTDFRPVSEITAPFPITELGSAAFNWEIAPGWADEYRYRFNFALQDRPGEVTLTSRRLTPDASYDLSEMFQPEVTITDLTYDRPARQWSVTLDAAGPVHTNTFLATFRWWRADWEEGGTWHVYLPSFGDVATPELPSEAVFPDIAWWLPIDDPIIEHSFWYEIWEVVAPVEFSDLVDIWGTVGYPALLDDLEALTDDYDVWTTHYPQRYRQTGL
jgi:hypothetical protein